MRLRFVLSLVLVVLLCGPASAAPRLWDVYSTSDQPFVDVTITRYDSDSLHMKSAIGTIAIHQDSIKSILQRNQAHPEVGVLGLLLGSVAGGAIASRSSDKTGLAVLFSPVAILSGALMGGLVGGIVGIAGGSAMGADTEYRIDKLTPEGKRKLLGHLFRRDGRRPIFGARGTAL